MTQRWAGHDNTVAVGPLPTRRDVLIAAGSVATATLAGCADSLASVVDGSGTRQGGPVAILAAGSLQQPFDVGLRDAVSVPLRIEAHGSVTAARLLAAGDRDPDIVALADPRLFETILNASWYAEFATNALVVAYTDTPGGQRVADASPWFDPVLRGTASLGRTDPDLDPLGYRTYFAFALGEEYYERPELKDQLLSDSQIYPETSLLSRVETGAIDAAVVYRSMAIDRGLAYRDLPEKINLGSPAYSHRYETASYELPDETVIQGAPISYAVQARSHNDRVVDVYTALVTGSYLSAHGFERPGEFPRYRGSVPSDFHL